MKIFNHWSQRPRFASHGQINNRSVTVLTLSLSLFSSGWRLAASAAGARAPTACARDRRDVHRTGRVPRTQRRVARRRLAAPLDAVLTHPVICRQESAPQDLRRGPAAPPAVAQARAQAPHPRELVAHQQPRARFALARALPPAPTWQIYARRILLGYGYTGQ